MVKTIGIYGYGAFGKLMAKHLSKYFDVIIYSPELTAGKKDKYASFVNKNQILKNSDILIFAVPVQFLKEIVTDIKKQNILPESTPIMDVTSVKEYPLKLLQNAFPKNPLLGTHPIFGPQSVAKYGLPGSKIVLVNVSFPEQLYKSVKNFLQETLQLLIIEKSAQEHDKEMAYVQGLSHFIGRALAVLDIQEFATETFSYKHLVELKELLKDDSWELFKTIQNYNPYTKSIRKEFLNVLEDLNQKLQKD